MHHRTIERNSIGDAYISTSPKEVAKSTIANYYKMDTKRPADEAPIDEGGAAVKKPKIEEGVDEYTVDEEVAIKTEEDSNASPPHLPPLEQKSPTQSSPAADETNNMKVEDDEQQCAPLISCNCAGCGVTAEKGGPLLLFQDPEEADNLDTDEKDGESKKEVEEEKRYVLYKFD